jgi:hypothetical protein
VAPLGREAFKGVEAGQEVDVAVEGFDEAGLRAEGDVSAK